MSPALIWETKRKTAKPFFSRVPPKKDAPISRRSVGIASRPRPARHPAPPAVRDRSCRDRISSATSVLEILWSHLALATRGEAEATSEFRLLTGLFLFLILETRNAPGDLCPTACEASNPWPEKFPGPGHLPTTFWWPHPSDACEALAISRQTPAAHRQGVLAELVVLTAWKSARSASRIQS